MGFQCGPATEPHFLSRGLVFAADTREPAPPSPPWGAPGPGVSRNDEPRGPQAGAACRVPGSGTGGRRPSGAPSTPERAGPAGCVSLSARATGFLGADGLAVKGQSPIQQNRPEPEARPPEPSPERASAFKMTWDVLGPTQGTPRCCRRPPRSPKLGARPCQDARAGTPWRAGRGHPRLRVPG